MATVAYEMREQTNLERKVKELATGATYAWKKQGCRHLARIWDVGQGVRSGGGC